jgi:hypothetical protein
MIFRWFFIKGIFTTADSIHIKKSMNYSEIKFVISKGQNKQL